MQYGDLEISTQILLVGLLVVLTGSMLVRVGVIFWRKVIQVPRLYPRSWTASQCNLMDGFCVVVGMILSAMWLALPIAAPQMPTNLPFGFLEAVSMVVLLLLTNAWLILLLPRDWSVMGAWTKRFAATLMILVTWWTLMFGGTAWLLANAASPPPRLIFGPIVASVDVPFWSVAARIV
jgi:hypothetical protein